MRNTAIPSGGPDRPKLGLSAIDDGRGSGYGESGKREYTNIFKGSLVTGGKWSIDWGIHADYIVVF